MDLQKRFNQVIREAPDRMAIAVSGGLDSITLMNLVARCGTKSPVVLTINHGFRAEAEEEVQFVAKQAQDLGLKYQIFRLDLSSFCGNTQSVARQQRYHSMINWCKENDTACLVVAHHRDDQAETMLMRIERGSGIDGLAAMTFCTLVDGISILRPLLEFSKNELRSYADSMNLKWMSDPSNTDIKYKRTVFRNFIQLSPSPEVLTKRLFITSQHAQRMISAILYYTRLALVECATICELGYVKIELAKLLQLPEEIAQRILLYSLMAVGNQTYKPRYTSFSRLFLSIWTAHFKKCTLCACKISKYNNKLFITREIAKISPLSMPVSSDSWTGTWDDRLLVVIKIDKCSAKTATVEPLGMHSGSIPPHLAHFVREGVNALPVVVCNEKILAYPTLSCDNPSGYGVNIHINGTLIRTKIETLIGCEKEISI